MVYLKRGDETRPQRDATNRSEKFHTEKGKLHEIGCHKQSLANKKITKFWKNTSLKLNFFFFTSVTSERLTTYFDSSHIVTFSNIYALFTFGVNRIIHTCMHAYIHNGCHSISRTLKPSVRITCDNRLAQLHMTWYQRLQMSQHMLFPFIILIVFAC